MLTSPSRKSCPAWPALPPCPAWAPPSDVVTGVPNRLQCCPSAGDVTGDRQPRPALERADERRALVEEPRGAVDLEGHQADDAGAGHPLSQVLLRHAVLAQILLRQVDAAVAEVLRHVLPVLHQLQGGTDLVRQGNAVRSGRTNDMEHCLAHW